MALNTHLKVWVFWTLQQFEFRDDWLIISLPKTQILIIKVSIVLTVVYQWILIAIYNNPVTIRKIIKTALFDMGKGLLVCFFHLHFKNLL